jgi:hypothetical protein
MIMAGFFRGLAGFVIFSVFFLFAAISWFAGSNGTCWSWLILGVVVIIFMTMGGKEKTIVIQK